MSRVEPMRTAPASTLRLEVGDCDVVDVEAVEQLTRASRVAGLQGAGECEVRARAPRA